MVVHGRVAPTAPKAVRIPTWAAKTTMAVTGLVMLAFVAFHMVGNLKIFLGAEQLDHYAGWLREMFVPLLPYEWFLWIFRAVMALALVLHVCCALLLWKRGTNTGTRGAARLGVSGWGAKLMLPTGILILMFIPTHLLDLTLGAVVAPQGFQHPTGGEFHAAHNVAASFARPAMSIMYLIILIAIAVHLSHGVGLAAQDLGAISPKARSFWRIIGYVAALAIVIGDGAVVIWGLTGGGGLS